MSSSKSSPAPTALDNLMTDKLMKRRLLIDGEGGGDDRRILQLQKSLLRFWSEDSEEELTPGLAKLERQLGPIEYDMFKTRFAILANEDLRDFYVSLNEEVKEEVEKTREEIGQYRKVLDQAKENRRQQQEYRTLTKLIRTQEDRRGTETRKLQLETELEELLGKQKYFEGRFVHRKRSMEVLMSAISRLDGLINEEEEETRVLEEAEKQAKEERLLKELATASMRSKAKPVPIEIDLTGFGNGASSFEQLPPGLPWTVPRSPMEPGREKYDELSE